MPLQIVRSCESVTTHLTAKCLLSCVDHLVFFVRIAAPETLPTLDAFEGLFARVRPHVPVKAASLTENPPAHVTREGLLSLVNRELVFHEAAFHGEALPALRAAELLHARVNHLVYVKLPRRAERLLAVRAGVHSLPRVGRPSVQLQRAPHGELLPAQRAAERFPVRGHDLVRFHVTPFQKELAAEGAAVRFFSFERSPLARGEVALGAETPAAAGAADRSPPPSRHLARDLLPFFCFCAVLVINEDSGSGSGAQLHCICW